MPSLKALFGNAARLTQKQAALTTLNTVTFPRLYHAIGKRLVAVDKLPPDLEKHRSTIRDMEAALSQQADDVETGVTTGLAAKAKVLAQQAVKKASKISADTSTHMHLLAAYAAMGKDAVLKYGDKVIPQNLKAEFAAASEQRRLYETELASLHSASRSFLGKAKRAGMLVCLLGVILAGAGTVFSLLSRQSRSELDASPAATTPQPQQASATAETATDRGPSATKQLPSTKRSFAGHRRLTDDELIEALSLAPDITTLDLVDSSLLTDKCIPAIASLKSLTDLHLPAKCGITPTGLRPLKGKKLEFVKLPATHPDTPEGFELFASMIGTEFRATPHDTYVGRPNDARNLGGWDLYDLKAGDSALQSLAGVRGIESLGTPANATDSGLAFLSKYPDLRKLHVQLNKNISNRGIAHLRNCKNLQVLVLVDDFERRARGDKQEVNRSGTSADGTCLAALNGMDLREIELPAYMRTDDAFSGFIDALAVKPADDSGWNTGRTRHKVNVMKTAADATLQGWPCTARLFSDIRGKAGIERIEIEGCECTDEMLAALGQLPDLRHVTIRDIPATGKGLLSLKGAKSLETIEIFQCENFSDVGIEAVSQCTSLRKIHFTQLPQITDEGITQLGALANSGHLQEVICQGTGVSSVGKVKLENLLPNCHVSVFKGL